MTPPPNITKQQQADLLFSRLCDHIDELNAQVKAYGDLLELLEAVQCSDLDVRSQCSITTCMLQEFDTK